MKNRITILLILSTLSLFAQKNKEVKKYAEDLSKVQPTYTYDLDSLLIIDSTSNKEESIITTYDITERLNTVLDTIALKQNTQIKYIRGYKVLIYSGDSQEEALEVRKAILEIFEKTPKYENVKVDFIYHQPMFRIKVGEYTKRLDAVEMTEFLKKQKFDFGEESEIKVNPLVVPDNINIREE